MSRKRIFTVLLIAAAMLVSGITAGTQLLIEQPVSATVTIESLGTSPTFNIIDNPFDAASNAYAGAAAGYISDQDIYVIDFGKKAETDTGANWQLSFGRSQAATVGSATDPIFYIENNYANDMGFDAVKTGGSLGQGTRIEVWNNVSVFGIPGLPEDELALTLEGAETPEEWVASMEPGRYIPAGFPALGFYIKIYNDNAVTSPIGGWNPQLKIVASSN